MQDERAACAVGDRHGDYGVQARLALEDAARGRVERAHLDELAARLARKGSRVVDGAEHECGGVARLPHVLVGELEPLGVGRIEDELCVGERLLRVRYSRGEDDCVLVLEISPSSGHVISRRSDKAVFLRQKDSSAELDRDQALALECDKNRRRYEDEVQERSSIEDVDAEVMARYKSELGMDASGEQVLRIRWFLQRGHLTNAGVLLFSENPSRFMPWARVRVLRFDGNKMETGRRLNIVKDRTFDGLLPKQVEGAKEFISNQLREFQYLGDDGRFKVIPEYPEFAWFEGLVNAVTHRDYAMSGDHIRVMMYDDRLEITSPGKLPNIVTLENMRRTRWSRTVIEEPTAPPSDSSLKISASRAFSAPFLVLAPTVREVRTVSPVTGSTWERVTSRLSVLLRLRNPLLVYLRLCIFEASFRGLASCPGFCRGRRTRPDRQNGNGRRVRGARRGLRGNPGKPSCKRVFHALV